LLLLEAAPGAKYKAALGVAYGAGLRVSEVANLKVSDIDSQRMVLRVEQGKGKGKKDATACCRRGCCSCVNRLSIGTLDRRAKGTPSN
jgi:site-specific recombinase XerD